MPLKSLNRAYINGRRAVITALKDLLVDAGWTLHQDLTAFSPWGYCMRSRGIDGTAFPVYLRMVESGTAGQILMYPYMGWNSTTRVGTQGWNTTLGYLTTTGNTTWTYVYASANENSFIASTFTTIWTCYSVQLAKPQMLNPAHGVLQSDVTAGTDVVIQLATGEADNFIVGKSYQIIDEVSRNWVEVTNVDKVNHTVTATLTYNFTTANFAMIGSYPHRWCSSPCHTTSYVHYYMRVNETATNNTNASFSDGLIIHTAGWRNPDNVANKVYLEPLLVGQGSNNAWMGYTTDDCVWKRNIIGTTSEHTIAVGSHTTGTATSGGVATLGDTTQAWTIDEYIDKVCVISAGTGERQFRKILSNTAIQLTVSENWTTPPDATSQYDICDEGYIHIAMRGVNTQGRAIRMA